MDTRDPGFRRPRYVRYADDHLLGFTGPKAEAEQIKQRLAAFLHDDLKLELSREKTLITHARTQATRFLGYETTVQHGDRKQVRGHRSINGTIALRVPMTAIKTTCARYLQRGKPAHRPPLMNRGDTLIISTYGAEYQGIVQYYLLASDVWRLRRPRWTMEVSMLKTLAAKHRSSVTKMARRYKTTIETPHGPRTCFQASLERPGRKPLVTRFGGIPLKRQWKAVLIDRLPDRAPTRKQLPTRLQARRCEWCGRRGEVHAHHVAKLADLNTLGQPQPAWAALMAQRRRKTLVVCPPCHDTIHANNTTATPTH